MRKLCPYDDKRYLVANLPDYRLNPKTYAYGNLNLTAEKNLIADQQEHGVELIIQHREKKISPETRPRNKVPQTNKRNKDREEAAWW